MSFADELRNKSQNSELYWDAMTYIALYIEKALIEKGSSAADICRNEIVVNGSDIFNFSARYMEFLEWLRRKREDGERIANAIEAILENNSMTENQIDTIERYLTEKFQKCEMEFSINRRESHSAGYYWMEFLLSW